MADDANARVLKYGLVQDGKIIAEDIISANKGLTIGTDPSNTISVSEGKLPKRHRLIEPAGKGYKITLFEGLDGKIFLDNQVHSVGELDSKGIGQKRGNYREVALTESSKGKLVIGKTTILFQLVPPPPPPPILKLPKELRASMWSGVDLFFVTVILLSALFHISLVTYLSSLEVTESLDEIDRFTRQIVSINDIILSEEFEDDEALDEKKPQKGGGGGKPEGGGDGGVENKGLLALITRDGPGGNVADILSEGLGDDLTAAINGIDGVDVARGSGPKTTKGEGGSGSGSGAVGVGDLGSMGGKKSVSSVKKVETKVKSKIGGGPGGISGEINQNAVYSVIRRRLGGVRYCYESQLKTNPSLAGKIRVQFVIGASGGVSSCSVVSNSMGNTMVQECVCRMVRRWSFPAPDSGTVTVGYTFIFSSAG